MKRNDDRGTVRVVSTESLLSISRAWLTVYCHKVCGYEWGLKRPVANWFVNRLGASSFSADISYFTRYGIASWAAWFVAQRDAILLTTASQNERVVIWALVAGLDSRRQWIMLNHATQIAYHEFYYGKLFSVKDAILRDSPWRNQWVSVQKHAVGLCAIGIGDFSQYNGKVLVVAEGVLDCFDEGISLRIIQGVTYRAPGALVLLDAQISWLLSLNNNSLRRAIGAYDLGFGSAPRIPRTFCEGLCGLTIRKQRSLFPSLIVRWAPVMEYFSMPKKIRQMFILTVQEVALS